MNDVCTLLLFKPLDLWYFVKKPELIYPVKSVSQHSKCDAELPLNLALVRVLASERGLDYLNCSPASDSSHSRKVKPVRHLQGWQLTLRL